LVRQLSGLPDLFQRPSGVQTSASVSQHSAAAAAAAFIATLMIEQSGFVNYSQTNVGHFPARSGGSIAEWLARWTQEAQKGEIFRSLGKRSRGSTHILQIYLNILKTQYGTGRKI